MPSHWEVYFGSDDIERSLATVAQLGGAVLQAAFETPYGHLAAAADPYGGASSSSIAPARHPATPAH